MNKKLPLVAAISALTLSAITFADSSPTAPTVFGNLNVGVTKVQDTTDIDGQAFEASLGVSGSFKKDNFVVIYRLEADFADATNNDAGEDKVHIKNALAVLPTKYGVFVVAPRVESGQQKELYKPVDIFEINEADSSSGLWAQPAEATSVFAYVTPKFNNTKVVLAALTLNSAPGGDINYNDEDVDVRVIRVIHSNDNLYLGAGIVDVSDKQLPTPDRYLRTALTAGYSFDAVKLGLTWEDNKDHPAGNFTVTGATADFKFNDTWSFGAGHTKKDADDNTKDNSATMLIVRNQVADSVYVYAEAADYDNSSDNYSLGINISF